MANVAAIRTSLQTRLKSISGLTVYDVWPDQINVPAAVVQPLGGDYEQTFGDGPSGSFHRFGIQVYVSAAGGIAQGQKNIDQYLATSSTGGIYGAINADRQLEGTVWGTFVRGYRDYEPAGGDESQPPMFWSVIVDIEVQTS